MGKETLIRFFSLSLVIKRKDQRVGLVSKTKIFCGNFARSYEDVGILGQTELRVTDRIFQSTSAGLTVLQLSLTASAEHLWKWSSVYMCVCVYLYMEQVPTVFDLLGHRKLWEPWPGLLFSFLCVMSNHLKWSCQWCFKHWTISRLEQV